MAAAMLGTTRYMPDRGYYPVLLDILDRTSLPDDYKMDTVFGAKTLALTTELYNDTMDVDQTKYLSCITTELLIRCLKAHGAAQLYMPPLEHDPLEEEPKELRNKLLTAAQGILEILSIPWESRMENLGELLQHTDSYINCILKINRMLDMDELIITLLETKKFWGELSKEKKDMLKKHSFLSYQLKSTSIFPLRYELGEAGPDNKLQNLFISLGLNYPASLTGTTRYFTERLQGKLQEGKKNAAELESISIKISNCTNCAMGNYNMQEPNSLIVPVLAAVTPPKFSTCWLNSNPRKWFMHTHFTAAAHTKLTGKIQNRTREIYTPLGRISYVHTETETRKAKQGTRRILKNLATKRQLSFEDSPGDNMDGIRPLDNTPRGEDVLSRIVKDLMLTIESGDENTPPANTQRGIYQPACSPISP